MTTQPLTPGQQLMLQRLLAAHVMTDEEATALFQDLNDSDECQSLDEFWRSINQQLSKGFGLEVATIALATDRSNANKKERFHAIVNQHADEMIKLAWKRQMTPHDTAFCRMVMEGLVVAAADDEEDSSSASLPRMDLINLSSKVKDPYKVLSLEHAERLVNELLDEHYLAVTHAGSSNRRGSMNQELTLGPRAYLELGDMLRDFGLEEAPQTIFHRG